MKKLTLIFAILLVATVGISQGDDFTYYSPELGIWRGPTEIRVTDIGTLGFGSGTGTAADTTFTYNTTSGNVDISGGVNVAGVTFTGAVSIGDGTGAVTFDSGTYGTSLGGADNTITCTGAFNTQSVTNVDVLTASKPVFTDASKNLVSTGTLGVDQGGTGATSLTDGGVLLGSGTSAVTATAVLGDGEILIGDGTTDPVALDVGSSTGITILGTVATGVWNGTAVADTYVDNDLTISGGTVDNSIIGGSTPAAGSFTSLSTSGAVDIADDQALSLGTGTAATKITLENDAGTTGVGSIIIGSSSVPQILETNPGAAVIPVQMNVLQNTGDGDMDDYVGIYGKFAVQSTGDSGLTAVGMALRGYVGATGGANNSVIKEAYTFQPWARHQGTGAVTAQSAISAKVDAGADNFSATTFNGLHVHMDGEADVTGRFDGIMVECYPDVDSADSLLYLTTNSGAVVTAGIELVGSGFSYADIVLPGAQAITSGAWSLNSEVYADVDSSLPVGSMAFGTGKVYIKLTNNGNEADWQYINTTDD